MLQSPSFPAFGQAISEMLDRLSIGPRYIYLHDYGAPVGFHIAMQAPERVLGLIVQNGNAHRTGLGPQWDAMQAPYWAQPTPENEAAATAHLTFEGTRDTYISGAPPDVVARMQPEIWEEDWRVMNLPGRHDPFFELAEVLSWMHALPRMEAHVLDAGHKLLETHAAAAVSLMFDFVRRTQGESADAV